MKMQGQKMQKKTGTDATFNKGSSQLIAYTWYVRTLLYIIGHFEPCQVYFNRYFFHSLTP